MLTVICQRQLNILLCIDSQLSHVFRRLLVVWSMVQSSSSSFLRVEGQSQRHPRSPFCSVLCSSDGFHHCRPDPVFNVICMSTAFLVCLASLYTTIRPWSKKVLRLSTLTTCPKQPIAAQYREYTGLNPGWVFLNVLYVYVSTRYSNRYLVKRLAQL